MSPTTLQATWGNEDWVFAKLYDGTCLHRRRPRASNGKLDQVAIEVDSQPIRLLAASLSAGHRRQIVESRNPSTNVVRATRTPENPCRLCSNASPMFHAQLGIAAMFWLFSARLMNVSSLSFHSAIAQIIAKRQARLRLFNIEIGKEVDAGGGEKLQTAWLTQTMGSL